MKKESRAQKIIALENSIKSLKSALPFADGQAYYQDKRRIAELQKELAEVKNGI